MAVFRIFDNHAWYTDGGRQVLGDLSRSPFAGRVHSAGNVVSSSVDLYSPSSSPDEEVIYIRGRRSQLDMLSSSFSEFDSDDDNADFLWTTPTREASYLDQYRKQFRASRHEGRKHRRTSSATYHPEPITRTYCPTEKKTRSSVPVSLQTELQAFSRDQLSRTIDSLVARHPQLEMEVRQTLSSPDLGPMKERLDYLKRAVYRAFPTFRWGSSRNSYCYRRVRVPIDIFKRTCIDQARTLVSSQCWEAVISYVEMAWTYVYLLPKFDDPANNRPRLSCFRFLAAQCMTAISNGKFTRDQLNNIRVKLIHMCHQHPEIEPCVKKTEKLLQEFDKLDLINPKTIDSTVSTAELTSLELNSATSVTESSVLDACWVSVSESPVCSLPMSHTVSESYSMSLESPVSIESDLELLMKDKYVESEAS